MADVGVVAGEALLVKIGDGGTPEVFTHPCLINTSRGVTFATNMTETEVPDCATPSNPAKIIRKARSIDLTVEGEGLLDATSVYAFILWWQSATAKNIQIYQNLTGANGGWVISTTALLSNFKITGERGDYQTATLSIVPASTYTIAQNA